jgi:hypothetical protein
MSVQYDLLPQRLETMAQQLELHPHLHRIGILFSETVLLSIDEQDFFLRFEKGHLVEVKGGPSRKTPWRFAFRIDQAALEQFWQPMPTAGFHDIFALVKIGRARIDGDILTLVKNLRFFKEFMALGRSGAAR